jgi:hypothetical protein
VALHGLGMAALEPCEHAEVCPDERGRPPQIPRRGQRERSP